MVAPDLEPTEELAARLLEAAFATSGQVCMAVKRLYVPGEPAGGVAGCSGGRSVGDRGRGRTRRPRSPWVRSTPSRPETASRT